MVGHWALNLVQHRANLSVPITYLWNAHHKSGSNGLKLFLTSQGHGDWQFSLFLRHMRDVPQHLFMGHTALGILVFLLEELIAFG